VIRYITLAEYLWLAEQVTGTDAAVLAKSSRIDLADSALAAPAAGFGGQEFYPDLFDKAAVLVCRLAWNHPWGTRVLSADWNPATRTRPICRLTIAEQTNIGERLPAAPPSQKGPDP
jgi:death-on-curing protein